MAYVIEPRRFDEFLIVDIAHHVSALAQLIDPVLQYPHQDNQMNNEEFTKK
jgi:hypothetical protein